MRGGGEDLDRTGRYIRGKRALELMGPRRGVLSGIFRRG